MLPKDPIILLSTVNTGLRDHHDTLEDFCLTHGVDEGTIIGTLETVGYVYDPTLNQFR